MKRHLLYMAAGLGIVLLIILPMAFIGATIAILGPYDSGYVLFPLFGLLAIYAIGRDIVDSSKE